MPSPISFADDFTSSPGCCEFGDQQPASSMATVRHFASSRSECKQVHPPSFVMLLLLLLKDVFFETSNHTHCSTQDLCQATDAYICMIAYMFVVYSTAYQS